MSDRTEKERNYTIAACTFCAVLMLISIFWVSPHMGDVNTYKTANQILDEKRTYVIETSMVISGLSIVIAAVPGDSTTPISNEISQFNTYLVIALAAIMFEKFILPLMGLAVFRYLVPVALLFICLYFVFRKRKLLEISLHLFFLSIALMITIPLGIKAGCIIDQNFGTEDLITELKAEMEDIDKLYEEDNHYEEANEAETRETEESASILEGLYNKLTDTVEEVGSNIKETVTKNTDLILEKSKVIISRTMDIIAVMIVANIVLPILVVLIMCWALRIAFTNIFLFEPEINIKR